MAWTRPLLSRGPIDVGEQRRPLPDDGTLPFLNEWRWTVTPDHSPGDVSFYREHDKILVAGDAFATIRQEYLSIMIAQTQPACGLQMHFTHDWSAADASVKTLTELEPKTAATDHGTQMHGEFLRDQLTALAEQFDSQSRSGVVPGSRQCRTVPAPNVCLPRSRSKGRP